MDNIKKSIKLEIDKKKALYILVTILLMLLSFWAGESFSNRHHKSEKINHSQLRNPALSRQVDKNRAMGRIASVSATSISVEDLRSGTTKTFSITSNTQIINNGASANASSLKVGDSVAVMGDSSNNASRINVRTMATTQTPTN